MFFWRSPAGIIHASEYLATETACGAVVGPIGSGWESVGEGEVTCRTCDLALGPRPTRVDIDLDGLSVYEYEGWTGPIRRGAG